MIIVFIVIFAVMLIFFIVFIYKRLVLTKKQKNIIVGKNSKLKEQQNIIHIKNEELTNKNTEILDSIKYAKRIQDAILPSKESMDRNLDDYFVMYQPKDIVSGDFYWMQKQKGKTLFAVGDCTGHGVSGAMTSMLCNNALNMSVKEYGLSETGDILDQTRKMIVSEFEKSGEDVKDGMDIALCSIEGNKLQYSGANNPLWIVRDGEVIEIKANKQPIGLFDNPQPYTTHNIDLEKGDAIYIFSDGYVDQFGGEKGKKLKSSFFRKILLSIQDKSTEEQKTIIKDEFYKWMGDEEQVDDVCVFCVKI